MERLTDNENYCKIIGCTNNLRGCSCFEDELYRKLKEYEDLEEQVLEATGADIASMVGEYTHYYNLQKENRLLELPCKVGTKLYFVGEHANGKCEILSVIVNSIMDSLSYKNNLGKGIFLTKAEAEKALAEMTKDCTDCRNYWQNTDTGNECNGQEKPCHEFAKMEK